MNLRNASLAPGALALLLAGTPARAQDDSWQFVVTPYGWMLGMQGTIGTLPGLPSAEASLSFSDILDNLDYAGFLVASARRGPLAFTVDGMMSQLSAKGTVYGPVEAQTRIQSQLSFLGATVGYALVDDATTRIQPFAGIRAWWVDTDLRVQIPRFAREFNDSSNYTFVDPIVGVSGSYRISENWSLFASAEIGGFGVGARMEWGVLGGISYRANNWLSIDAGWRHLDVNYRDGPTVFDVYLSGPIVGATIRF